MFLKTTGFYWTVGKRKRLRI